MTANRSVLVLAAGQGTRMKSSIAKVLHPIAGIPMVAYAVANGLGLGADPVVVVVGHDRDAVTQTLRARFGSHVEFAVQEAQRGTADAVRAGLSVVPASVEDVVITYGDAPCVPREALVALVEARVKSASLCALISAELPDATGYGRIVRDDRGRVVAIREHKDCSEAELAIRWFNPGLYSIDRAFLAQSLATIGSGNAQGEFYLTDLVSLAAKRGGVTDVRWRADTLEGINDRVQLAEMERMMWKRIGDEHRLHGVTIVDGARIDRDVTIDADAWIGASVSLRGKTHVGAGARIDVGCVIDDSAIGRDANVKPYSVISRSDVGDKVQIGPFAHVRPESVLEAESHVGNFVELKKTRLGRGAKANHLAYLGDGVVGANANVGAGTIFCNYDGERKHTTTIGAGAFIGSNSSLVAPVTVGDGAYVASGSVVTSDVPPRALAIGRARQVNKDGYADRLRTAKKHT